MGVEKDFSASIRNPERGAPAGFADPADTPPDPPLDRVARLASHLLGCPAGLVCLSAEGRLVVGGHHSTSGTLPDLRQTVAQRALCRYAAAARETVTVEDAREDAALRDSPMVTQMGLVAYAGVPLLAPEGRILGVLCVIDAAPRRWTGPELADLRDLADAATLELHHRRSAAGVPGEAGGTTDATRPRPPEPPAHRAEPPQGTRQLAGGIAHDFNNLLTGIIWHATLLEEEAGLSETAREDLAQIQRAAERAASLTRQLLASSRRQVLAPRVLDVNDLVSGCLSTLRRLVGERVQVTTTLAPGVDPIVADANQIEQVLTQLCANARDAMADGGGLEIATGQQQVDTGAAADLHGLRPGAYVLLQVRDTGRGMDASTLERIFEPGEGAGRGLTSVYGIVRQSGGHIEVASEPGVGTTFTVYIPRHEGSAPLDPGAPAREPAGGTETILLVEDETQVLELARRVLSRAGYTVLAAADAESAMAIADRRAGHIHLLVTDMALPRLSGRELAARLSIHRPAIKVLYISGTSDGSIARMRLLEPGMAFLEKPFSLDRLLRTVRQSLGDPGGSRPP